LLCVLGTLARSDGDLEQSISVIDRALDQNPLDDECWLERSRTLRQAGNPAEADAALKRALELAPQSDRLRAEQAILTLKSGQLDDIEALTSNMMDGNDQISTLFLRAVAASKAERGAEADQLLSQVLALDSRFAPAWFERGMVRFHLTGDLKGARSDLQRASELTPDLAPVWFELAGARYKLRDCGF